VVEVLRDLGATLWEAAGPGWEPWARRRVLSTLAAGVAAACEQLCPEFSSDEVIVDVGAGVQSDRRVDKTSIWLTERVVGGGGVVEEVHRRVAADPRRFLRLLDRTLVPSDFEVVDVELRRILDLAVDDDEVSLALATLRGASRHDERHTALERLVEVLQAAGVDTRHAVISAANARILRPGTSPATDAALRDLARDWSAAEQQLGVELETRVFAYACRNRDDLDRAVQEAAADAGWRYGQVLGVLWPHGWRVRANSLSAYNEFAPHAPADPQALRAAAPPTVTTVEVRGDWWSSMAHALVAEGLCELQCSAARPDALADALTQLGLRPIDTGSFLLHAFVERVDRDGEALRATVALEAPSV
jgi:hypothetical protein